MRRVPFDPDLGRDVQEYPVEPGGSQPRRRLSQDAGKRLEHGPRRRADLRPVHVDGRVSRLVEVDDRIAKVEENGAVQWRHRL